MTHRPVIGITTQTLEAIPDQLPRCWVMSQRYVQVLVSAGAIPWVIPLLEGDEATLRGIYERSDALFLPGGVDIDPATYGETRGATCGRTDPARDWTELLLTRWALADAKPVRAVCRGAQLLNVAIGGTLYQDLRAQWPKERPTLLRHRGRGRVSSSNWVSHPLHVLQPDSRLAMAVRGRGSLDRPYLDAVLSMHHQAVQELAACLEVVATSSDEVIEAIEETSSIRWWVGVQFHPEWMTHLSWSLGLFTTFVDASRGYSAVPREEIETLLDEIQAWLREHDRTLQTAAAPFALTAETQSERLHAVLPLQKHAV